MSNTRVDSSAANRTSRNIDEDENIQGRYMTRSASRSASTEGSVAAVAQHEGRNQRQSKSSSYHQIQTVSKTSSATVPVYRNEEVPVQVRTTRYTVVDMGTGSPQIGICRFCGIAVNPVITYEPTVFAYLLCLLCCIVFPLIGLIFAFLFLFGPGFREPRYSCPYCGSYMGIPY